MHAACLKFVAQRCNTVPLKPTIRCCGCESKRSPQRAFDMAIRACTYFFVAKGGESTANACIGFIAKKACQCGTKRRRRKCAVVRRERQPITAVNHTWSMDFMADNLADGRKIRLLTIVDNFSRECIALEVGATFTGAAVASVLSHAVRERGAPRFIRCDNGTEFVSKAVDQWAYWNKVELDFSRPGKPTDNAFCESFNGRVRQELLNASWFESMADAQAQAALWRMQYNHDRPHGSLSNLTPAEFARSAPKHVS